ncbi:MAG: DedA family protein [Planctomycetes bacterium]|nr:DedA family protein [Planctomycetota bacterium]
MRETYDWMMRFAHKPYAERALFGISFAEASFFPIPPDPLLMVMGAAQPNRAIRYAFVTTIASVLGALFGFAIGMFLMDTVGIWILDLYDSDRHVWSKIENWFSVYGLYALLLAALTPIPFKVFTIATGAIVAGGEDIHLFAFLGASFVGRGARFFTEGILLRYFGEPIVTWMEKWFDWIAVGFSLLVIGGFAAIKYIG